MQFTGNEYTARTAVLWRSFAIARFGYIALRAYHIRGYPGFLPARVGQVARVRHTIDIDLGVNGLEFEQVVTYGAAEFGRHALVLDEPHHAGTVARIRLLAWNLSGSDLFPDR